jgi:Regulator of ribonuclease activity B
MSEWQSAAAHESLLESVTREGWDLSRPRHLSHDVVLPTQEDAEGLASDLKKAGYIVDSLFYDHDYDRWELGVREGEMIVTADAMAAAQARIEPLIRARHGKANGIGVTSREEER